MAAGPSEGEGDRGFTAWWIVAVGCFAVARPLWDSGEKGAAIAIGVIGALAGFADIVQRRRDRR